MTSATYKIIVFLLFVFLLSSNLNGFGQTTIWEEDFTYSDGTTTGSGSPLITSWTADGTTNSRGVEVQNNKLQGYRTKGASGREYWTIDSSDPIEISGYSNVTISINLRSGGNLNASDSISVYYSLDGSASWISFPNSPFSGNMGTPTIAAVSGLSGSSLKLLIRMQNDNKEYYYADDILVQGIPPAGPTLSVSPTSIDFGNICLNTTAVPESFTITGTNLTTANVTVAALAGYTYSTTAGGTYTSSLSLSQGGGNYSQTIYVKFTPTAIADYNGNIVVGGGGASNVNVAVTGSGAGFAIPLIADANTVACPNSTNGTIDLSVPYPIQFNVPDYIDINSTLLSNRTAFSLEGWIKVDLTTIGSRISLFGQNDAIEFGFSDSNTLMCWTASGGSATTGAYPSDNAWHHVAAVGNGISIILYIDGNPVSTGGSTTTNYGNDTNYSSKIGAGVWDPTGGYFPGQMIKVGFWSSALSAGEISNLASTYYYYTGSETGLLAGYNFFEGTGTTLGSATAGTDGSFNGTPTWVDNYSYLWTKSGDAGFSETTQDLSGVGPGTYNVIVTNSSVACSNTDSWTINHLDTEDPIITCPADVTVNPDAGLCTASGVDLGTPTTADNCGVASVTNDASEPFAMGNTIVTWTVTNDAGNTATCQQTITVEPVQIIDIAVVDLGNSCQSGETGSTTIITWDITKLAGSDDWTYDYVINDSSTDVQTGINVNATGNIQISYVMNNETTTNKTFTITISNVKDSCGVDEINTINNSDTVTLYGVPATSDITTN